MRLEQFGRLAMVPGGLIPGLASKIGPDSFPVTMSDDGWVARQADGHLTWRAGSSTGHTRRKFRPVSPAFRRLR
jgi:hypothetical protein